MEEKVNYPNNNTKIDHFLAFQPKAIINSSFFCRRKRFTVPLQNLTTTDLALSALSNAVCMVSLALNTSCLTQAYPSPC